MKMGEEDGFVTTPIDHQATLLETVKRCLAASTASGLKPFGTTRRLSRIAVVLLPLAAGPFPPAAAVDPAIPDSAAAASPITSATPSPAAALPLGADEATRAAWEQPRSIVLKGPFRQVVESLASAANLSVLIDRRVDPNRPVSLAIQDVPLGRILTDLAGESGAAISWVGPVVYLGPPETAGRLRTLVALRRNEVTLLPADLRAALSAKKTIEWNDLEEPQSLWIRLTAEAGLRSAGVGMPHDLWPAVRLPALSLVDRLTLLAIGFDRTFVIDAATRTIAPAPIPEAPTIERSHPAPPTAAETVRRWQTLAPQAAIRRTGDRLTVVGREEDHEAIASGRPRTTAPAGEKPVPSGSVAKPPATNRPKPPPGTRVFSMRAQRQPLRAIIGALRQQGNEILFDAERLKQAGIDPDGRTSVDTKDATLAEVLEEAGKPLGLTARQVGKAVELVPIAK
jgi:hypothetical protein